jgi:hypothetical protein
MYRVQTLTTAVPTITADTTEDMTVEDMEATASLTPRRYPSGCSRPAVEDSIRVRRFAPRICLLGKGRREATAPSRPRPVGHVLKMPVTMGTLVPWAAQIEKLNKVIAPG